MSSSSTLYELNKLGFLYHGICLGVGWAGATPEQASMVDATCTLLDTQGNVIRTVGQRYDHSSDGSTIHASRYFRDESTAVHSVASQFGYVNPEVGALYYSLYSPEGLQLGQLPRGWTEICAVGPYNEYLERVYTAPLADFRGCQGVVLAGFLRMGNGVWYASHVEKPVQAATDPTHLVAHMQEHMTTVGAV